jgi:calcineurin-like phosphoesterase family protein
MSAQRFVISDHHLRHPGIYRFTDDAGQRIRPRAETADEADEMMIAAWNDVVRKNDTVYHLGDVAIRRPGLRLLERLNGRKILIRGNHDIFKLKDYTAHFADIRGTHKIDRMILSHYPSTQTAFRIGAWPTCTATSTITPSPAASGGGGAFPTPGTSTPVSR